MKNNIKRINKKDKKQNNVCQEMEKSSTNKKTNTDYQQIKKISILKKRFHCMLQNNYHYYLTKKTYINTNLLKI